MTSDRHSQVPLAFSAAEYAARLSNTKTKMEERGIDVLLLVNPANICYLTGYDLWSLFVPQWLVVSIDAEQPLWVGRAQHVNGARINSEVPEANIFGYPDNYVQSRERHPADFLADRLLAWGYASSRIGLELSSYFSSAGGTDRLRSRLSGADFVDASELVNWIRIIKSEQEIAYMREAARIIERVMGVAVDRISPGVRLCDVVAEVYHAQVGGQQDFAGDYTAIPPLIAMGRETCAPHLHWSDRRFSENQIVCMELAGARRHYHCPMARSVYLGSPPPEVARTAAVVVEGLEAVLDFIRPGRTAHEIAQVWRRVITRHGISKESRIGYSTGLNFPPDWGEHTISLREHDETELAAGMTLHCIPGVWTQEWGILMSECILVTQKASEPLASFPRELLVKH